MTIISSCESWYSVRTMMYTVMYYRCNTVLYSKHSLSLRITYITYFKQKRFLIFDIKAIDCVKIKSFYDIVLWFGM